MRLRFINALPFLLAALPALALLLTAAWPGPLSAQVEPKSEITPVMATGRAVIGVADHAIVVAVVDGGGAPGAKPPEILPIGSGYIGVLFGNIEWDVPGSKTKPLKLDADLPRAAASAARRVEKPSGDEPSDIEKIGIATLELLRPQLRKIHDKLKLAPDQPIFELLLADYAYNYGPELWRLEYRVKQQDLGNDYWDTQPMRPSYYQLYPPDKGHPHTLMETAYPKNNQAGLLDGMQRHDTQLDAIGTSSAEMGAAINAILTGNTPKATVKSLADFLHSAMPVAFGSKAQLSMALLEDRRGFQWLIAPDEALPPPDPAKPPDPGAPTLRKYEPTN
jgi:hypothetical protein